MAHDYLIAEDDPDTQLLIRRAFKQADLSAPLYFTNDGEHTIDYLSGQGTYADRAQFPMPAILLLDLKMPFRVRQDSSSHDARVWRRHNMPLAFRNLPAGCWRHVDVHGTLLTRFVTFTHPARTNGIVRTTSL